MVKPIYQGDEAEPFMGVLKCADGCPSLAWSMEQGRKLAEEHGW